MATQAYYDWNRAGRPFNVCIPVANLVTLARRHGVPILGTIGNDDHLQSNNPQDHTPFSVTAWPNPLPGYIVTAGDIADGPHVDRLIADAKSGRAPWIKYINARGKQWNVKNGWNPVPNSDQHCHVSARTDHLYWTDSSWDPFTSNGSGDVIVDERTEKDLVRRVVNADENYLHPTLKMDRDVRYIDGGGNTKTMPNLLVRTLAEIRDGVTALGDGSPTSVIVDAPAVADALIAHPEFMTRLATELAANLAERLKN